MMRVTCLPLAIMLFFPAALLSQSEALTERFMLRAKAAYVGGYVVVNSTPCMAEKADGELLVGVEELEFRFQPKRGSKELENCRSVRPSQLDAKGRTKLVIPYDRMCALARGQYPPAPLTNAGAILAGLGALGSIFGTATTSGETRDIWIGSAVGALTAGGALWALSHRKGNYISIFFRPTSFCGPNPDPFEKGDDVAIFQLNSGINGPHDYWNLSMILNARTGRTFVSEAADKSASEKKSGDKSK